ncbi:hypothetical protein PPEP_b0169 [Pseudoalteromonas peptidolytica F12-50-A1]|uniref:Uncharacterized protein n=1 Tax=Pseudoalteromonas peptidolytica F12-50-A1 TaxID=1315280 RepID=A0A8I0N008_9GAMM|nr:hypothetical protein [Pseudoalteromonas peptidolytica F12-50-A1]
MGQNGIEKSGRYIRKVIPIFLIKWSILRRENLVDNQAKILLFSCSK